MAQTVIYYNMERGEICDSKAIALNYKPTIAYGEKPTWVIMLIKSNTYAWDTSGITAWRASIAFDFDATTAPACRTTSTGITSSGSMVTIQLDANTSEFLSAVNGNQKTNGWFELAGYDSNGNRVCYLCFDIIARMVMDPDSTSTSPTSLTADYLNTTQLYALLRATNECQFNTTNSGTGHSAQTSADLYYRFRNSTLEGNWSDWIMLPSVASPSVTWDYVSGKPTLSIYNRVITIGTNSVTVPEAYTLPTASTTTLGGVKVDGTTVTITNGVISAVTSYTLPTASTTTLGGVKVDGTTITITSGVISAILPTASTTTLGGVKVDGSTITITDGVISAVTSYTLPTASTSTLGGVKVDGTTIVITDGVISAVSSGSGSGASAAADVTITDSGSYFTGTTVEAALQEIGSTLSGLQSALEAI